MFSGNIFATGCHGHMGVSSFFIKKKKKNLYRKPLHIISKPTVVLSEAAVRYARGIESVYG